MELIAWDRKKPNSSVPQDHTLSWRVKLQGYRDKFVESLFHGKEIISLASFYQGYYHNSQGNNGFYRRFWNLCMTSILSHSYNDWEKFDFFVVVYFLFWNHPEFLLSYLTKASAHLLLSASETMKPVTNETWITSSVISCVTWSKTGCHKVCKQEIKAYFIHFGIFRKGAS